MSTLKILVLVMLFAGLSSFAGQEGGGSVPLSGPDLTNYPNIDWKLVNDSCVPDTFVTNMSPGYAEINGYLHVGDNVYCKRLKKFQNEPTEPGVLVDPH